MTDLAVIMSVCHNDKLRFVQESVESILNQTFKDFHFFIAFDGPVSPEVDRYFMNLNDDRIRLYRIETNGGLARALNYLLEIVLNNQDYQFIARMDADDISFPSRFDKQHRFLSENPDITCLGCWYHEINESGNHVSSQKLPVSHNELRKLYMRKTPFAHPTVMYRRSLIEKAGYYPTDTILMEDNALWGNALKNGLKFANVPEYLLKFRKDRMFYMRRSGIKYGWNFIKTRFKINRSLQLPIYSYVFSFLMGVIKMMPSYILRFIYVALRRY